MTPDALGHKHPPCGGTEQMDILSLCQHLGQMSAVKFCITTFNQFPDLQLFLWAGGGCQLPISSSRKQTLTTGCMADSLSDISYVCNSLVYGASARGALDHHRFAESKEQGSRGELEAALAALKAIWAALFKQPPPPPPLHPASRQSVAAPLALAPRPGQLGDRLAPVRGVIALREGKAQTGTVGGSMATEGNHRRSGSRTRRVCAVEWRSRARNRPNVRFL